MRGQWIGDFEATPGGKIIINIDELEDHYEGTGYLHPNGNIPKAEIVFRTESKDTTRIKFSTDRLYPIHPTTHQRAVWEEIKNLFAADAVMSKTADVEGEVEGGKLILRWKTDIGLIGQCSLGLSEASKPSTLAATEVTWDEFKAQVVKVGGDQRFIFRGQSEPWRLRTSFHRHGRSDLRRFVEKDLPLLHKHLSARTRHHFDLRAVPERS